ncbi:MAG: hypothetical protein H6741_02765 [Alphaproteobacteria bacterium]|nr:hypothetical protein [Alphaproteobacteria bacterium]MCB9791625.1 hypothetical protein [Alphaproteobacteria bacterium]
MVRTGPTTRRPRFSFSLLLLLGACHLWRVEQEELPDPLLEGHALFERRAEGEDTLWQAIDAYRRALVARPGDPEVLHALARAYNALAWGYRSDASQSQYGTAREYAMQCLETSTGFSSRVEGASLRIDSNAVKRIEPKLKGCLDELLVAWLRWTEARGASAAVDFRELKLLARRARTLNRDAPGWIPPWSSAMIELLLPGRLERDLGKADAWLSEASELERGLAIPTLSRGRWLALHEGDRDRFEELLGTLAERYPAEGPWALENRAAAKRAKQDLADIDRLFSQRWEGEAQVSAPEDE